MRDNFEYTSLVFIIWGSDWGKHPTSTIHLANSLITLGCDVIWVNSIGMRSPKLSFNDFRRIYYKLRSMLKKERVNTDPDYQGPLYIFKPFVIPFYKHKIIRKINSLLMNLQIRKLGRFIKRKLITITTLPNTVDYINYYNPSKKIYYVLDDFATFPGVEHESMKQFEQEMYNNADVIIFSSNNLLKNAVELKKEKYLLTHGVDVAHFKKAANSKCEKLNSLTIGKKIIGFYGLIDDRIDLDLILRISFEFSNVVIYLVGPSTVSLNKIANIPNIIMAGSVDYSELPGYLSCFDAAILPYMNSIHTQNIYPLKLKEYLAAGKDIVATELPGTLEFKDYIYLASNHDEFIEDLRNIIDSKAKTLRSYECDNESWESKARYLIKDIIQAM